MTAETNPKASSMQYISSYKNDPLYKTVIKWGWGLLPFTLVLSVLWYANLGVVVVAYAILWPDSLPAVVEWYLTPAPFFLAFFVPPLLSGFYYWMSKAPGDLVKDLLNSAVFDVPSGKLSNGEDPGLAERLQGYQRLFSQLRWPVGSFLLSVVGVTAGVFLVWLTPEVTSHPTGPHHWEWYAITYPMMVIGMYMMLMIVARAYTAIAVVRDLFRIIPIRLFPWHPDRCGGLKPLSRYTLRVTYIIAAVGFTISLRLVQSTMEGITDYYMIFWLAVYSVVAPYIFFATLGTAHYKMRVAKEEHLCAISQQFTLEYEAVHTSLKVTDSETLGDSVKRMEHLQHIYRLTETFPVWPFDAGSIRRFFSAVVGLPILPFAISAALQVLPAFITTVST